MFQSRAIDGRLDTQCKCLQTNARVRTVQDSQSLNRERLDTAATTEDQVAQKTSVLRTQARTDLHVQTKDGDPSGGDYENQAYGGVASTKRSQRPQKS